MPWLCVHAACRQATSLQHPVQHVCWHRPIQIVADSLEDLHALWLLSKVEGHSVLHLVPIATLRRDAVTVEFRKERSNGGSLGYRVPFQADECTVERADSSASYAGVVAGTHTPLMQRVLAPNTEGNAAQSV